MESQTEAKVKNGIDMLFLQLKDNKKWQYTMIPYKQVILRLVVPDGIKLTLILKGGENIILNAGIEIITVSGGDDIYIGPDWQMELKSSVVNFKIEEDE